MKDTLNFNNSNPAILALSTSDQGLGSLIKLIGSFNLPLRTDFFASLVRAIIGQQLSVKVAETIWDRLYKVCEEIKPEVLISMDDDVLRSVGLSKSKIIYIKDLSGKVLSKEIDFMEIQSLDDQQIIEVLTSVKGIGRWTARCSLYSHWEDQMYLQWMILLTKGH
ncbi:hypothetical protein N752_00915 [Desulforamulus aquiferis]|nr:hypothetical protein [Desulforamulus aquiferis]RYD07176.1 hypothetical protein N752_00915 [Desulforamulus aquiferis]